jgi:hypothetical protein
MANDVLIERTGCTAKVRNPWLVLLFTVLTLGVYAAFWWYFVNRELRDLGLSRRIKALGEDPTTSVLAYTLGSLIYVPLIWTVVTTTRRVQAAQRITGQEPFNGWVAALFWIGTFFLGGFVYLQYQLNKVWRAPGMRPAGDDQPATTADDLARAAKLESLYRVGALNGPEYEEEKARLGFAPG